MTLVAGLSVLEEEPETPPTPEGQDKASCGTFCTLVAGCNGGCTLPGGHIGPCSLSCGHEAAGPTA